MPIIATTPVGKDFKIASEGVVQAVLNKIEDLGMQDQTYKGVTKKVHKVRLWWQINELDEDGKTPIFLPEKFTLSLHESSQLFARIKGLFGKNPPQTLDLEKLIGTNTNLVIAHAEDKNGKKDTKGNPKKYANIAATTKLTAGQAKLELVPMPDRSKKDAAGSPAQQTSNAAAPKSNAITPENPIDDSDVPF